MTRFHQTHAKPIADHMAAWEEAAIDKCRNDPNVIAAGQCPVCMCSPPCLCDRDRLLARMREYYEKHTTFWRWRRYTNERPGYLGLGYRDSTAELIDHLERIARGKTDVFIEAMLNGTLRVGR
jgi:hypothetical protein